MKIIISPAKKMKFDLDSLPPDGLPQFLPEAGRLRAILQGMDDQALKALWRCNDALAARNHAILAQMELDRRLTPAVLSFEGIQYRYMAPGVLEREPLAYLQAHLRILSGFYGLLRPFDGVTPYRLEMQARLSGDGFRSLYDFWGDKLARALCAETGCILNLASQEYSRAVLPHLPAGVRVVTCRFGERREGKLVEKGTLCKMARGEMVRFLAERRITEPSDLRAFDRLGYLYAPELSTPEQLVFVKTETREEGFG